MESYKSHIQNHGKPAQTHIRMRFRNRQESDLSQLLIFHVFQIYGYNGHVANSRLKGAYAMEHHVLQPTSSYGFGTSCNYRP